MAVGNIIATIMRTQDARNSGARRPRGGEPIVISMVASPCCQTSTAHAAAANAKSKTSMTLCSSRSGPGWALSSAVSPMARNATAMRMIPGR